MTEEEKREEFEKMFFTQQVAKAIIDRDRPWWYSGGACLSAGSLLFLALLLVGWLVGWWPGGWQLGITVIIIGILAISGAGQYSRSKKDAS